MCVYVNQERGRVCVRASCISVSVRVCMCVYPAPFNTKKEEKRKKRGGGGGGDEGMRNAGSGAGGGMPTLAAGLGKWLSLLRRHELGEVLGLGGHGLMSHVRMSPCIGGAGKRRTGSPTGNKEASGG